MTEPHIQLLRDIAAGRVFGEKSAAALGMHPATFWRRIASLEGFGVKFEKNARGGRRYGPSASATTKPWRIRAWGVFKGERTKWLSKRKVRTS